MLSITWLPKSSTAENGWLITEITVQKVIVKSPLKYTAGGARILAPKKLIADLATPKRSGTKE